MKKSSIVHGLHEINKTELSPDIFMRVNEDHCCKCRSVATLQLQQLPHMTEEHCFNCRTVLGPYEKTALWDIRRYHAHALR